MQNTVFFVEKSENLYENHLFYLRKLYLPILGSEPVSLYCFLFDLFSTKNVLEKTNFTQDDVCSLLNIDSANFLSARKMLEAVGLLRTYLSSDAKKIYLVLIKPLNIEKFHVNKFLKSELVKKIGPIRYENIYFSLKNRVSPKDDYREIGITFSDLFSVDFEPKKIVDATDEISFNENISLDQAIKTLPSILFLKYLTKNSPSFAEKNLVNYLIQFGFQDNSINYICNYSFEKNNRVVPNFVKKIMMDLYKRDIMKFSDIVSDFKNIRKQKPNTDIWGYPLEEDKEEKSSGSSSTEEIDFDKLFEEINQSL